MCLIFAAVNAHPKYPLIIAANRDEFYDRPTAPARFWLEAPQLLAGRDLRAGGTWLGITRTGRIAALTNYRDPKAIQCEAPSRGKIVADFLLGRELPVPYLERLSQDAKKFDGFSVLVGLKDELYWYSNYGDRILKIPSGIHGLSNHLLDTPWPKVEKGRKALGGILTGEDPSVEDLFRLLSDQALANDESLPDTGVGLEWERTLSPIFIVSPDYGTRSSTIIMIDRHGRTTFSERSFGASIHDSSTVQYEFLLEA